MISLSLGLFERLLWLVNGVVLVCCVFLNGGRVFRKTFKMNITIPMTNAIMKTVNVKKNNRAKPIIIQRASDTLFQIVNFFDWFPIEWNIIIPDNCFQLIKEC